MQYDMDTREIDRAITFVAVLLLVAVFSLASLVLYFWS